MNAFTSAKTACSVCTRPISWVVRRMLTVRLSLQGLHHVLNADRRSQLTCQACISQGLSTHQKVWLRVHLDGCTQVVAQQHVLAAWPSLISNRTTTQRRAHSHAAVFCVDAGDDSSSDGSGDDSTGGEFTCSETLDPSNRPARWPGLLASATALSSSHCASKPEPEHSTTHGMFGCMQCF